MIYRAFSTSFIAHIIIYNKVIKISVDVKVCEFKKKICDGKPPHTTPTTHTLIHDRYLTNKQRMNK